MIHYDETHYILYPRRLYTFCIYIRYDLHLIFDKTTMFPTIPTRFSALESVGFGLRIPQGLWRSLCALRWKRRRFFHHRNMGKFWMTSLTSPQKTAKHGGHTWRCRGIFKSPGVSHDLVMALLTWMKQGLLP